jgi:hypothetical protein
MGGLTVGPPSFALEFEGFPLVLGGEDGGSMRSALPQPIQTPEIATTAHRALNQAMFASF